MQMIKIRSKSIGTSMRGPLRAVNSHTASRVRYRADCQDRAVGPDELREPTFYVRR